MRLDRTLLLAFLLLSAFVAVSLLVSSQKSALYEETDTVSPGYYFLKTNDYRMNAVHPPLSYKLGALPLLLVRPAPIFPFESESCKKFLYYVCNIEFLYRGQNNGDMLIFLGRLPFIALGVALGFFVFLWARSIYGDKAGLLALALYAFNPVILGWMGMAINDSAVAAFLFMNMFFFVRFVKKPSRLNLLLTGITLGLAQASKITALFAFVVYALFFAYMYRRRVRVPFSFGFLARPFSGMRRFSLALRLFLNFALIVVVAYSVVFAIYGFQFSTFEAAAHPNHVKVLDSAVDKAFSGGSKAGTLAHFVINRVPVPFVSYFEGIGMWAFLSATSAKPSFFAGEIYSGKKLLFHPLSFLVKTPIPLLILLLLVLCVFALRRSALKVDEAAILLIVALFLLMFILVINWNSGIQHLLPIYPFLFVLVGKLASASAGLSRALKAVVVVLGVLYVAGGVAAFPNYLSYFNEFMGPDGAYRYFVGSNNDMGQDLKPLAKYLKESGIAHVYLSYFGTVPPEYYGINYTYLPSPFFEPWVPGYAPLKEQLPANFSEDCSVKKGIVAISITNLNNVYLVNQTCFGWLREYQPVRKIGHTIFIYNIT